MKSIENFKYYEKKKKRSLLLGMIVFSFRLFENFSTDFFCQSTILFFFKKSALELTLLHFPNFFLIKASYLL